MSEAIKKFLQFAKAIGFGLRILSLVAAFELVAEEKSLWTTDCLPFGRHAVIATLEFDQQQYQLNTKLYASPGCALHTVEVKMLAEFNLGKIHGEGIEFNHMPKSVLLSLKESSVVAHYNKHKICGFEDWRLLVPKDISGAKGCVGFNPPQVEVQYYDLYLQFEDQLIFSWMPSMSLNQDRTQRPLIFSTDNFIFYRDVQLQNNHPARVPHAWQSSPSR